MKRFVVFGFAVGLLGMVGTALAVEADPISDGSWTMVILPDTQHYSLTYPAPFYAQTAWIAAHKDTHNIKMVLHEGDITHTKTTAEFGVAKTAMDALSTAGVPYSMCAGNHDYTLSTRATLFNDDLYFGPNSTYGTQAHFQDPPGSEPALGGFYESGKTDNSWCTFNAGGKDWLVFSVEYGPRDNVVTWMNSVAAAHPNHNLILNTHAYLYYDSTRYDYATYGDTQSWSPHAYGNDGQQLWDKLVKNYENWKFTFNGHVLDDGAGWLGSYGTHDNVVQQILANYQIRDNGGDGYLRIMEFMADGDTVKVSSYSPTLGAYLTDYEQDFTLTMSKMPPVPPTIHGVSAAAIDVPAGSATDATSVWSVVGSGPGTMALVTPPNRADFSLSVSGIQAARDRGVMMATVRQNLRDGSNYGTVEVSQTNAFATSVTNVDVEPDTLQVATSKAPGGGETNMNVAVGFFPFANGWISGHVTNVGGLSEHYGVTQSNVTHLSTGRYTVSVDGVDSQTDGMLLAVSAENGYNYLSTAPLTDGTGWEVATRDNLAADFVTFEDNRFSFVYVDYDAPGLIGGRVATSGSLLHKVGGNITVVRNSAGVYQITIPGYTPSDGVLLLTMTEYETSGTTTAPADDIISYEASGGTFLVNIRDRADDASNLQNGEFVFAFLPFDQTLMPAVPGDANYDGQVDSADAAILADHWGDAGATWAMGDFNLDGVIGPADASILAANWDYGIEEANLAVPEPSALGLLLVLLLVLPLAALLRWGR